MEIFFALFIGLAVGIVAVALYFKRNRALSPEMATMQEKIEQLQIRKDELQNENQNLSESLQSEKIERAKIEEQLRLKDETMAEWEKRNEQLITKNNLEMSKSMEELATKLFNENKKQSDTARTLGEKKINDVSANLQKHFDTLMGNIKEFDGRLGQQESGLSILQRVLTEPAKIGSTAELILENNLKAAGLTQNIDFLIQKSFETDGGKLRPDAVIALPDDNVIVIDSKASSFLASLAFAESDESHDNEAILKQQLKASMRKHLKDLTNKDYHSAVKSGVKFANREFKPKSIMTLMWVPTDGVYERISNADPELSHVALEKGVLVGGPSALQATIAVAAIKIEGQKQSENQIRIVEETEALLKHINTALKHATQAGRAIHSAYNAFDNFAASVNRNLLSKAKHLIDLGITQPKGDFGKPLPRNRNLETIEATDEGDNFLPEELEDESQDN